MKRTIANPLPHRGFSLLEVLVSLLIFSLGLMGLAAMLVMSVRTNQSAYIRTQANFLAQSMADRMRANVPMVWGGNYSLAAPGSDPCADASANCSRSDVAARDLYQWKSQVATLMPPTTASTIACTQAASAGYAPSATEIANGAPYSGTCTITLKWNELSLNRATQGGADVDTSATPETLAWTFTP